MMQDREISMIATFRLQEVAGRLSILARVTRSSALRQLLLDLSRQLAEQERAIAELELALEPEETGGGHNPPPQES